MLSLESKDYRRITLACNPLPPLDEWQLSTPPVSKECSEVSVRKLKGSLSAGARGPLSGVGLSHRQMLTVLAFSTGLHRTVAGVVGNRCMG